jgi:hypothetical protein
MFLQKSLANLNIKTKPINIKAETQNARMARKDTEIIFNVKIISE